MHEHAAGKTSRDVGVVKRGGGEKEKRKIGDEFMVENLRCMWRPMDDVRDKEKGQNRVLCLDPPICLYILAYKSDES